MLVNLSKYAVWCPPDSDMVQLCTEDGHVLLEMSPAVAVMIGEDLIAHGKTNPSE